MMFAEAIQDMLNALSVIPAYVRELERQNTILQQSNEMNANHVLQLEKQLRKIKEQQGHVNPCLARS